MLGIVLCFYFLKNIMTKNIVLALAGKVPFLSQHITWVKYPDTKMTLSIS